jgi:hypothetical protein
VSPHHRVRVRFTCAAWALRWLARWIAEAPATIGRAAEVASQLAHLPSEPCMFETLLARLR